MSKVQWITSGTLSYGGRGWGIDIVRRLTGVVLYLTSVLQRKMCFLSCLGSTNKITDGDCNGFVLIVFMFSFLQATK